MGMGLSFDGKNLMHGFINFFRFRSTTGAKHATAHWWAQRVTAILLIPLLLWFVASIISLVGAEQEDVRTWIGVPWVSILLIFMFGVLFHHTQLGLQVVLEDYVHTAWLKSISIIFVKIAAFVLFIASSFAILIIVFAE